MASTHDARNAVPLMLVHGAWLSPRSWERFADHFANRGFAVSAPEWPRKRGDVEQVREEAESIGGLGLTEIIGHYETVPETGQIFYEAGFANFHAHPPTELAFESQERAPLVIVGAEEDYAAPALLSHKQYAKYERSPARTDYLEFEGRPHLFVVGEGWQEVAAAIDGWLDGLDAAAPPAS